MITCTQRELVIIDVFGTYAPTYLLHLLAESARRIAETLEDTANGRQVIVVFLLAHLEVFVALIGALDRHGGHERLVGIGCDGEAVVLINGNHQRCTETQVGRDELRIVVTAEIDLRTDVRDIQTQTELTLTLSDIDVVLIICGKVNGER